MNVPGWGAIFMQWNQGIGVVGGVRGLGDVRFSDRVAHGKYHCTT